MPETVDTRLVFNRLRVHYVTQGPNTSLGNVNVSCPWCGDDPSAHLMVSETKPLYYCLRNRAHSGSGLLRLLLRMGVPRLEALAAMQGATGHARAPEAPVVRKPLDEAWGRLELAGNGTLGGAYLARRGYDPDHVATTYDLRYARAGSMAQRLWFPCRIRGTLETITGRAMRAGLEPRYYAIKTGDETAPFIPTGPQPFMVIVEGPFDALRFAVAMAGLPVGVAAIGGLRANRLLGAALRGTGIVQCWSCYDRGVTAVQTVQLNAELAYLLGVRYIKRLAIPGGAKDVDELPTDDCRQWARREMGVDRRI